ncbi:hypothetical protein GCM10010399_94050 [Dactylosporangium fulvum]|uniref:Lipoprotein n=1 Tax=Dactylosporangium fulvum TaxID=53359 RepID=A0ABY5VWY1_9ACTN|nr:hypothetical protein [Dactylosporangium fulvum]UWP82298.1 hypothetical protein Dfulv_45805 [Dactylosporangium fulvum]
MGRLALAVLLVFSLAACGGKSSMSAERVTYQADYPAYDTLAALHAKASLVVSVRLAERTEVRSLEHRVYTVLTGTVERTFKGPGAADVEIKQPGGEHRGTTYTEAGGIPLQPGRRYLLFLETYPDSPASLLNPGQAQYLLDDAGRLEPVDASGFSFTLAELEALGPGS